MDIGNDKNDRGHSNTSFYVLSNEPIRCKKAPLGGKLWGPEILSFSVVLLCQPQARQFLALDFEVFVLTDV